MITSRSNETIKRVARLARERDDRLCVLEGPHLVGEAQAAGWALELVLVTPRGEADGEIAAVLAGLEAVTPTRVADEVLERLADADSPRGLIAVAQRPPAPLPHLPRRAVWLDAVQDPGNVGAIARVLEAAGGDLLLLGPGSAHPHHPRALRASAGSLLRLPWRADLDVEGARALTPGCRWLALDAGAATGLWELPDVHGGDVLALGAEGRGLSPVAQATCELALAIPLMRPVESLNVATAAAVVLFELRRRQVAAGG